MTELWDLFESATYLKPQEQIGFRQYGIYVTCKPDLLILYKDADPILVDWKVHRYGIKDYRQQLALYALALTQSPLPKKYPMELAGVFPTDVRLREVQLLTKHIYPYDLVESEINEIKSIIGTSSRKMELTIADEGDDFTYFNPLHVKYVKGELDFEKCLEDVYFLTTLTWTNPRDCAREPITIRLTDRYLNEEAGEYSKNDLIDAFQALKEVSV